MNEESDLTTWQLTQVWESLELLAAGPEAQIAYLERLGTAPSLDELALEFDDARRLVPGLVSDGAVPDELDLVVRKIDARLHEMSSRLEFWQSDAIDGPEWDSVRQLARRALELQ